MIGIVRTFQIVEHSALTKKNVCNFVTETWTRPSLKLVSRDSICTFAKI